MKNLEEGLQRLDLFRIFSSDDDLGLQSVFFGFSRVMNLGQGFLGLLEKNFLGEQVLLVVSKCRQASPILQRKFHVL